jgi:hypothetical protein
VQNKVIKLLAVKFLLSLALLVAAGAQLVANPLTNNSNGNDWQSATAEEQKQYCDIAVQNLSHGAFQVTSTSLRDALNSMYGTASPDALNLKVGVVVSALAAKLSDENNLLGTWHASTTGSVESFGASLLSADGQIKITRDASGKLIGSGSFSAKTKSSIGYVTVTKGAFTACTLQYIFIPRNAGVIDDASPNRYRVSGNFSGGVLNQHVTTAQLFFSNHGMLALQCGGENSATFDRIFFVKQ